MCVCVCNEGVSDDRRCVGDVALQKPAQQMNKDVDDSVPGGRGLRMFYYGSAIDRTGFHTGDKYNAQMRGSISLFLSLSVSPPLPGRDVRCGAEGGFLTFMFFNEKGTERSLGRETGGEPTRWLHTIVMTRGEGEMYKSRLIFN